MNLLSKPSSIRILFFHIAIITILTSSKNKRETYPIKFVSINTNGPEIIYLIDSLRFVDTVYGCGRFIGAGNYTRTKNGYKFHFVDYDKTFARFQSKIDTIPNLGDTLSISIEIKDRYTLTSPKYSIIKLDSKYYSCEKHFFRFKRDRFPIDLEIYGNEGQSLDTIIHLTMPADYVIQHPELPANTKYSTESNTLEIKRVVKSSKAIYKATDRPVEYRTYD